MDYHGIHYRKTELEDAYRDMIKAIDPHQQRYFNVFISVLLLKKQEALVKHGLLPEAKLIKKIKELKEELFSFRKKI
jgi:hypothetical protein